MFSFLSKRAPVIVPARVPDGMRIYAVGDVHGRIDLFDQLLALIDDDHKARSPQQRMIVLLGDLIDRGPDSCAVVDRAIELATGQEGVRLLAGNHEEIFLLACSGDRSALKLFTRIGGRETALSYGIDADAFDNADYADLQEILETAVPADHLAFLRRMEETIVVGDYAFVHAGIRPGVALEEQEGADLRWIRDRFLHYQQPHQKFIVHGHTISPEVDEQSNRLGIDTGAYATGKLTAVALEGDRRWFLQT